MPLAEPVEASVKILQMVLAPFDKLRERFGRSFCTMPEQLQEKNQNLISLAVSSRSSR